MQATNMAYACQGDRLGVLEKLLVTSGESPADIALIHHLIDLHGSTLDVALPADLWGRETPAATVAKRVARTMGTKPILKALKKRKISASA